VPEESLIPMFESMVDRALSRTNGVQSLAAEPSGPAHTAAESVPVQSLDLAGLFDKVASKT
jgi:hypothetical protein